MLSKSFFSFLAVCTCALPLSALAQVSLNDMAEARGYGMANMLSSAARGTQALYANPASLSFDERFEVESSGTLNFAKNSYKFFGIGIADSKAGPVAAALSYHMVGTGPKDAQSTAHLLSLAIAVPIIAKMFHLGVSGRQHFIRGPQNSNPFNLNAGMGLLLLNNLLAFSLSAHNLMNTSSIELPRYFVLAGSGNIGGFLVTVEKRGHFNNRQSRFTWGSSLEYSFREMFAVRGGYAYDQVQKANILGVGFGFFTPGGSVDLGYRYTLGGARHNVLALTGRFFI